MLLTEHVLACCFLRLAVRPACSNHSQRCPAPALMSTMPLHGRLGLHLSFLSLGAAHRHFPLPSGAAPLSNFKALHKLQRIHKIHKLHKTSKALWVGFAQRVVREHEKISPFLVFAQSFHSSQSYSSGSPGNAAPASVGVVAVAEEEASTSAAWNLTMCAPEPCE